MFSICASINVQLTEMCGCRFPISLNHFLKTFLPQALYHLFYILFSFLFFYFFFILFQQRMALQSAKKRPDMYNSYKLHFKYISLYVSHIHLRTQFQSSSRLQSPSTNSTSHLCFFLQQSNSILRIPQSSNFNFVDMVEFEPTSGIFQHGSQSKSYAPTCCSLLCTMARTKGSPPNLAHNICHWDLLRELFPSFPSFSSTTPLIICHELLDSLGTVIPNSF